FHLSQYDAAPLYTNPAMTGMFIGQYRIHGHYRNQWSSIVSPFSTTAFSYDTQLEKINVGGIILNDRAGTGNYNVLNLVGSAAYDYTIDKNKKKAHHIAGGFQAGIIHKSVDIGNLIFSKQWTSTNSNPFDPGLPNGEIFSNTNFVLPELNLGLLYYMANDGSKVNPFIGFSVFHLLEPNETFFENENKLPRRYVMHTGVKINLAKDIQITPKILIMNEGNDNERTITLMGTYFLKNADAWIFAAPTYRSFKFSEFSTNDAIIATVGLKYGSFSYGFSYDLNISSLSSISNGRGGFELSITYIAKKISFPKPACPRL
ncbi:MAG: PorP/SprF family type IX secretion system membrane protein, partial [Flavobacteriales bacterium]|nr:PorP/SprF family type IX secretion system membrane protein [Flavobacteriales bacterium]